MKLSQNIFRDRYARYAYLGPALAVVFLLVACLILYGRLSSRRAETAYLANEMETVFKTADQLRSWMQEEAREPWLKSQEKESEFGVLLEKAADKSGIRKPRLASIEGHRSRILDRNLGERIILVRLKSVTLDELTGFLFELASRKGAPHQKEIELRRTRDDPRKWDVSLKLSLLFKIHRAT